MQDTMQKTEIEQIQKDVNTPSVPTQSGPDISGAEQLQATVTEVADSMEVNSFKCAHPECGLVHEHSTNKHRASDDFDMSDEDVSTMEANSVCHCGLNELALRGVSDAPSPEQANNTAPIRDSMSRHLEQQL